MTEKWSDDDKVRQEIVDAINASPHGGRLMSTLCQQVGPRPAGSAAMRQAAEMLAE